MINMQERKHEKTVDKMNDPSSDQKTISGIPSGSKKSKKMKAKKDLKNANQVEIQRKKRKVAFDDSDEKPTKKLKTAKNGASLEDSNNLDKKALKKLRQKNKNKVYELAVKSKQIWEALRRDNCPDEKKAVLLNDLTSRIKGHVKQLIFAHDTCRVIECIMQLGTQEHRTSMFEELKDHIILMSKSKYAKFFVLKILKYGTKEQKNYVLKCFHGQVVKLLKHKEASAVVEFAYNEYANATQRAELVQEVYGPNFALFKDPSCTSLAHVFEKEPSMKKSVITHMKEVLLKLVDKTVIRHSIVHHLLYEFVRHADVASRAEILGAIKEAVPEILHTKDGAKVAMNCVWHGTTKDRKIIVKCMKTFVTKIAKEEHGHLVLLAIFDCVDDTKLVEKVILSELMKNPLEVAQDQFGRKVLWYLIFPRDPVHFHPDVVRLLKQGDSNETSKKDPGLRRRELQMSASPHLLKLVETHVQDLVTTNSTVILLVAILNHAQGDCTNAFNAVADLIKEPYFTPSGDVYHYVEHPGTHFLLKKLILDDSQRKDEKPVFFSSVLVERIPLENMATWINCNRGAFLLLSLLESGIEGVVQNVRTALRKSSDELALKKYKGAQLLLSKLNVLGKSM